MSDVRSPGATEWPGFPGVYTVPEDGPRTGMDWHVEPSGMTRLLVEIGREYPEVPLVVTENGSAFPDSVAAGGQVEDHDRAEYLRAHVAAVHDAIEAGVDVRGLLRLVPAGQLRMGLGLLAAVRHRPRRLRDAGAPAQGVGRAVPGDRRRARGPAGAVAGGAPLVT